MGSINAILLARPIQVKRLYFALLLIFISLALGISGFMLIEDLSLVDAFYMTIITVSTVGFEEVVPLSIQGKVFTAFLIITNIGIFTYALTIIASFIIEGQFKNAYKNLRIYQKIMKLENHTIICGFGRNGEEVCKELHDFKQPFVVIEIDGVKTEQIQNENNYLFIEGDATHDDILRKAGIENAKALVSALPKDADNLYVALTAKEINPNINVICRASEDSAELRLKRAGADHVIMPEKIGGSHMAKLITKPDIIEFFNVISSHGGVNVYFEEIELEQLAGSLHFKTIRDLDIRKETGVNIIGLKTEDGQYHVNPAPNTVLEPTCKLIVLGDEEQIGSIKNYIFEHQQ